MQVCQSAFWILQSAALLLALNSAWNSRSSSVHSQSVCCPWTSVYAPSSRGCVVLQVTAREGKTLGTGQSAAQRDRCTGQLFFALSVCLSGGGREGRCFVLPLGGAVSYGALPRWSRERCRELGKAGCQREKHWEAFRELLTSDEWAPQVTREQKGWSSPSRFPGMSVFAEILRLKSMWLLGFDLMWI